MIINIIRNKKIHENIIIIKILLVGLKFVKLFEFINRLLSLCSCLVFTFHLIQMYTIVWHGITCYIISAKHNFESFWCKICLWNRLVCILNTIQLLTIIYSGTTIRWAHLCSIDYCKIDPRLIPCRYKNLKHQREP